VNRGDPVVSLRREHVLVRPGELQAQNKSLYAAYQQENDRRREIPLSDLFVVDSRKPPVEAVGSFPNLGQVINNNGAHVSQVRLVSGERHFILGFPAGVL
jgi:hypothetical protein